ncbi:MAG TPA: hypothetical protein VEH52_14020 [Gaiellaceae bacterium]|nr:hypothetical protein [Gaiellaceae bacterium]
MSSRLRRAWWPDLSEPGAAERSLKAATVVAYLVAAVTGIVALLALLDVTSLVSPWYLVVALVFAVIGFFISRRSRTAAVSGLTLYVVGAIANVVATGGVGVVVALIFTMYLLNGVRAAYHLARVAQEPAEPSPSEGP